MSAQIRKNCTGIKICLNFHSKQISITLKVKLRTELKNTESKKEKLNNDILEKRL